MKDCDVVMNINLGSVFRMRQLVVFLASESFDYIKARSACYLKCSYEAGYLLTGIHPAPSPRLCRG